MVCEKDEEMLSLNRNKKRFLLRVPESLNSIPVLLFFVFINLAVINDIHAENYVLLNLLQEFIEMQAGLLLTCFLHLHNQLISIQSIVT